MRDAPPEGSAALLDTLVYARVSTDEQTPALQLDDLRQAAAARGWNVIEEYVDDGVSGRLHSRPALDRMIARVLQGGIQIVAVWKLDRLGRSLQHLVEVMELFREHDVEFVSLRDAAFDTTTASGRLIFQIMAALAEFESSLIGERTKAGMAAAKRRGSTMGRKPIRVDTDAAIELMERWDNANRVATALGISPSTLRRRLKAAGYERN